MKNKIVKTSKKVMVIMAMTAKKIIEKFLNLATPPIMTGKNKIMVPGLNEKKQGKMIKTRKL
jgi:hypothetical protein